MNQPAAQSERALVLMFRAGGERAAVRAADIQKVTPLGHISRLPRLPAVVSGITQHRGRVVTVVDAGELLFSATHTLTADRPELASSSRLLILERPVRHLALRVDAVDEIEAIRLSLSVPQLPGSCLRVTQHKGQALQVLNVDQLMAVVESHF